MYTFCALLTIHPFEVILCWLPWGISLKSVRAFNSIMRSVCDLLLFEKTLLNFSLVTNFLLLRSTCSFSSRVESLIFISPRLSNLRLRRLTAATTCVDSLTQSMISCAVSKMFSFGRSSMFVAILVTSSLYKGFPLFKIRKSQKLI